jgi:hypothetical protein
MHMHASRDDVIVISLQEKEGLVDTKQLTAADQGA